MRKFVNNEIKGCNYFQTILHLLDHEQRESVIEGKLNIEAVRKLVLCLVYENSQSNYKMDHFPLHQISCDANVEDQQGLAFQIMMISPC